MVFCVVQRLPVDVAAVLPDAGPSVEDLRAG